MPRIEIRMLDITDPTQIRAAAERCGDVSLLVNNAGINFNTPLIGIGADNARAEIETNYLGTLAMCRAFAPVLARNGGGAIVNMLSVVSWFPASSTSMVQAPMNDACAHPEPNW